MTVNEPIIFAPATPAGQSGVAVYRISGRGLQRVFAHLGLPLALTPRKACLCELRKQASGAIIDQALVIYFPAPHSFTGEDVLELHTHGGSAIRACLLDWLSQLEGCRLAEAGEFSRRAFTNNKMDLLQAEGIADLIASETAMQQQQALRQMSGTLSNTFSQMRSDVLRALALLEAYLDFPDEEIPEQTLRDVQEHLDTLRTTLQSLLEAPPSGEIIREGLSIAIIGPPNAGKSQLLNRLAKRDVAIVSPTAGTTRDRIEIQLNLEGYLVRLIDTAGLREADDAIEIEGIRRSHKAAAESDLTLVLIDITSDTKLIELPETLRNERCIVALNKSDLADEVATPPTLPVPLLDAPQCKISAKHGDGIDTLMKHITDAISGHIDACPSPILTRARHRHALSEALAHLQQCDLSAALELCAEELRLAARAIGKITGHIDVDQLLDVIFREFCIGK